MMLSIHQIESAAHIVAREYPIKRISLFGSYAAGTNNEKSDLDFLVEFISPSVSLLMLSGLKNRLVDLCGKSVDVIHAPLHEDALISVENEVLLYES